MLCLKCHEKVYQLDRWSRGLSGRNEIPVYDILNAGPRNRFQTAAATAHNCLAWLSKDKPLLDAIRSGLGIYEAFAVSNGMWSRDMGPLKKTDPKKYAAAKASLLGLGYGASAPKFMIMADLLTGGEYKPGPDEAARVVAAYRRNNRPVTSLWKRFDNGIRASLGKDYEIGLPSGRDLVYRKLATVGGTTAMTMRGGKPARTKLYHTLACENACQATARDVMAHMLDEIVRRGHEVVLHVHDEVVVECDADKAEAVLADVLEVMHTPPPWMRNLPVAAEGGISSKYKK